MMAGDSAGGYLSLLVGLNHSSELRAVSAAYPLNAKYAELFPLGRRDLYLLDKVEDGARFPRGGVFVWHGKADTVVPVEGSLKLAEKLKELDTDLLLTLAVREGEHGFDATSSIDEQWMKDGLEGLVSV